MPLGISEEQIQHSLSSIPRFYSCYCFLREILQEVLFVILAVQYFYFLHHLLVVPMISKSLKDIFTLIKKVILFITGEFDLPPKRGETDFPSHRVCASDVVLLLELLEFISGLSPVFCICS